MAAASANMAAAVIAVQMMPGTECRGWYPTASTTVDWTSRYTARAAKAYPISLRPRRWRSSPVPDSSQITTVDAPISISESRPNPASATDRAETAAMARITIPATFQASVAYSSANPRRSKAFRAGSVIATAMSLPAARR